MALSNASLGCSHMKNRSGVNQWLLLVNAHNVGTNPKGISSTCQTYFQFSFFMNSQEDGTETLIKSQLTFPCHCS